ncbi:hypothetical protein [Corynebacterium lubricantis]|uniref:hypothetical protein n=1 Tax=Corynebacterium lubricantis TaxID=541095 RepID=UPI00036BAEBC|nr:hypothetical protein [Corynebacterium lubricantis]
MAKIARIGAAIAATALTVGLAAPAAQAQTGILDLVKIVNGGVDKVSCKDLGTALRTTKLVDGDTTRSELVANLNKAIGGDSTLKLVTASTINKVGDRALECKIVKADQLTPVEQAIEFSSQLSAEAGLPEVRNLLPALPALAF